METLLTKKQLKNLTTERLNEYRKKFPKKLGQLRYTIDIGNATEDDHAQYRRLNQHYSEIKDVLSERENLSK